MSGCSWDAPLKALKGIGDAKSKAFALRGITSVGELLSRYPRRYENRGKIELLRDCTDGEVHSVLVTCTKDPIVGRSASGVHYFRFYGADGSGSVVATFFNRRFLAPTIRAGRKYRLYGRVTVGLYGAEMSAPEIEPVLPGKPLPAIVPIYTTGEELTQNAFRSAIRTALESVTFPDELFPKAFAEEYGLLPRGEALRILHFPENEEELQKAKYTASFTEFLTFRLALYSLKEAKRGVSAHPMRETGKPSFLQNLPFTPTNAQRRAIREIFSDLEKDLPMTRLVQGDVGSGKTVVAAAALERCVQNGFQGVLIAPTEILAQQHAEKLASWFSPLGIRVALLTGGVPKKQKEQIKRLLQDGGIDLVIGTHAVLQEDVSFAALGLVVTDEQHRFGVRQRASLLDKSEQSGKRAHMLVLSATPIPRSLSLILYGDLDVTILNELPPGRQPIDTMVLYPKDRNRIYASVLRQLSLGGQAYIICPLVEENQDSPRKAAEEYFAELKNGAFAGIPMGLLHGKMTPSQKNAAMQAFARGETKILVSTTVIEVGVDVPNANVMLIENAECFGLSQLHQLRGRIGRGSRKSFCVLLNGTGRPNERLSVMKESSDGFVIAEADLKQRGPGDFFGEAQSGEFVFRTACLTDLSVLERTSHALEELLPQIERPEYQMLRAEAMRTVAKAGSGKTLN